MQCSACVVRCRCCLNKKREKERTLSSRAFIRSFFLSVCQPWTCDRARRRSVHFISLVSTRKKKQSENRDREREREKKKWNPSHNKRRTEKTVCLRERERNANILAMQWAVSVMQTAQFAVQLSRSRSGRQPPPTDA